MPRGFLAVTYANRHGALGGNHVAAGENSRMAGHHVGSDLHRAILDLETRNAVEQRKIHVLPSASTSESASSVSNSPVGCGKPLVERHFFDRQRRRVGNVLDRRQAT